MIARFEVFKDKRKNWRFRLRAANGRIIASSEGYSSKRNAYLGIDAVREYAYDSIILEK